LVQPVSGYRAGFDAVLLAASVPLAPGSRANVLDAGSGVGAVGLSLAVRVSDCRVTLVEREPELARMAGWNIACNAVGERCRVVEADLTAPAQGLESAGLEAETQDVVVANPPYFISGSSQPARDPLRAASHQMADRELERWMRFAARMLKPHGTFVMIHRTEALAAVIAALDGRFGDLAVVPIHSREGEPARRFLLKARKGSRAPLRLMPGLIVHEGPDNAFKPAVKKVCSMGAGLDLF
jgi:tRNA1(Val) A37 N6-methylase TrmN6